MSYQLEKSFSSYIHIVPYCIYIERILPKGPYPPFLRIADRALLAGYPRYDNYTQIKTIRTPKEIFIQQDEIMTFRLYFYVQSQCNQSPKYLTVSVCDLGVSNYFYRALCDTTIHLCPSRVKLDYCLQLSMSISAPNKSIRCVAYNDSALLKVIVRCRKGNENAIFCCSYII